MKVIPETRPFDIYVFITLTVGNRNIHSLVLFYKIHYLQTHREYD